jgi:transcriptional regulator with XRE-family HTH domain
MEADMEAKEMDRAIGKRVRAARVARDLTLEELSDLCSVSVSYLGFVERGQKPASLTILKKLALGLHLPLTSFLSDVPKSRRDDPLKELLKLAAILRKQTPENRRRIVRHWNGSFDEAKKLFSRLSK